MSTLKYRGDLSSKDVICSSKKTPKQEMGLEVGYLYWVRSEGVMVSCSLP